LGVISMVFFINKTICLHWILTRQGSRQRELPEDGALCWIAGNGVRMAGEPAAP